MTLIEKKNNQLNISNTIEFIHIDQLRNSLESLITSIQRQLYEQNKVIIIKNILPVSLSQQLKQFCHKIGSSSFGTYHSISDNCPDHHRFIDNDKRAYVPSMMHIYSFFPWNQNPFRLFQHLHESFVIRNKLSDIEDSEFLQRTPRDQYVPRIGIQHYPKGGGFLHSHEDPTWELQKINISIQLSNKKSDYDMGGLFIIDEHGNQIIVDVYCEVGDAVIFPATRTHGVEPIDPEVDLDWFSEKGRWSLLPTYVPTQQAVNPPSSKAK